jgi:hypothetical protein
MATDGVEGRIREGEAQLEELHGRLAEVERGVKAAAAAARDGLVRLLTQLTNSFALRGRGKGATSPAVVVLDSLAGTAFPPPHSPFPTAWMPWLRSWRR